MAHGRQRSLLSVARESRRRCSVNGQGRSAKSPRPHEPPTSGRLTVLLKLDVEQLKEAMAAPHSRMRVRSPMGAYRTLVAKCAPDGFRESLVRFPRR
jgi:hypothetical protein